MKPMKIAFSGPSGLGKTTLANIVADRLEFPHPSTSAGDVFTEHDKFYMRRVFGYEGKGHQNVINMSAEQPKFGYYFQHRLLTLRAEQIAQPGPFVLDRCPIDNIVYMLTQVGHNLPEDVIRPMIEEAQEAYMALSHIIMIRYSNDIPQIEDNDSRVPNRYFQQYISDVFGGVYTRYFAHIMGPRVITLDFWRLQDRISTVMEFVKSTQLKAEL